MDLKRIAIGFVILGLSPLLRAEAPRYNTARTLPPPTKAEVSNAADRVPLPRSLDIPKAWVPYLNPAYEEFWTEGTHKPDAGFMLFARNPTSDAARLWLIRMETKAKVVSEMYETVEIEYKKLINEGVISDRYGLVKSKISSNLNSTPKALGDTQIYFLYSSTCPQCEKQAKVLSKMAASVIPLQVDSGKLKNFKGLRKSDYAGASAKKDYLKGSVPVLVISNRKSGKIKELTGVQSLEKIMKGVGDVSKLSH